MLSFHRHVSVRTADGMKFGVIVARTYEENPHYDVRLNDGTVLVNVASELVAATSVPKKAA